MHVAFAGAMLVCALFTEFGVLKGSARWQIRFTFCQLFVPWTVHRDTHTWQRPRCTLSFFHEWFNSTTNILSSTGFEQLYKQFCGIL